MKLVSYRQEQSTVPYRVKYWVFVSLPIKSLTEDKGEMGETDRMTKGDVWTVISPFRYIIFWKSSKGITQSWFRASRDSSTPAEPLSIWGVGSNSVRHLSWNMSDNLSLAGFSSVLSGISILTHIMIAQPHGAI